MRRIPLLPFVIAFLAGRIASEFCPPTAWPGVGLGLLFATLAVSLAGRLGFAAFGALLALFGTLGYAASPPPGPADDVRFRPLDRERPCVFEGRVLETQPRAGGMTRAVTDILASCTAKGCEPANGRVALTFEAAPPGAGSRIRFRSCLSRFEPGGNPGVTDNGRRWLREGYVRKGFVTEGAWSAVRHITDPGHEQRTGEGAFSRIRRWRQGLRKRLEAGYAGNMSKRTVGLALGLALGDRSRIDETTRGHFANAGLAHLLAISGTHMALIALGMEIVVRNALLLLPVVRRKGMVPVVAPLMAAGAVAVYAAVVGLTPAMGRALLMAVAMLSLRAASRRVDTEALLVLAALVVGIVEPSAVWDIGCQLSFVSVLFLVRLMPRATAAIEKWTSPLPDGRCKRATGRLAQLIAVSGVATVGTAPLCAYYFQAIPWIGVVANVLAVPLVAAIGLPLVIMAGVSSLAGIPGSSVLFGLADTVLGAGIRVADFFGGNPHLSPLRIGLTASAAAAFAGMIAALLLDVRGRRWVAAGATVGIAALLWTHGHVPASSTRFRVTQLNVGQGDCFILHFPDGKVAVLDGGGDSNPATYLDSAEGAADMKRRSRGFDPGRRIIEPYLRSHGYDGIDLLILSHPHPDHIGGLLSLVQSMPVREAWIPEVPGHNGLLSRYVDLLLSSGVPVVVRDAETRETVVGGVHFRFLHPKRGWRDLMATKRGRSTNNSSMVMIARYGRMDMLFTGDMEKEVETLLVESGRLRRVEVVKVPHHGSDTSSTRTLVDALRPEVVTISVGRGNRYGFPRRSVVRRWALGGATVFRTDLQGAVDFATDGDVLEVTPALGAGKRHYQFQAFDDRPEATDGSGPHAPS